MVKLTIRDTVIRAYRKRYHDKITYSFSQYFWKWIGDLFCCCLPLSPDFQLSKLDPDPSENVSNPVRFREELREFYRMQLLDAEPAELEKKPLQLSQPHEKRVKFDGREMTQGRRRLPELP